MGHPLPTNDENILTGSGQVTELWRHKSNNIRPIFHGNRDFSNVLVAVDWNGDIMRDLGQNMSISDLRHCILTFRRSFESQVTDRCFWDFLEIGVFGISWGPEAEYEVHFWHRPPFKVFYRFGCQWGHFTQFALGRFIRWGLRCSLTRMLYITNIRSICRKNASFCSELNGEHVSFRYDKKNWDEDL